MNTTLTKPKRKATKRRTPKPCVPKHLSHSPNYISILPVGCIIEEKIFELGIDVAELARRMELPLETVEKLIRFEVPLTREYAEKLEKATWMPADVMMRFEAKWREALVFAMEHPEIPAYLGGEIINQEVRS